MNNRFHDHFSAGAADYSTYRPGYPSALFAFLATLAPGRSRAWDCATGAGQAAIALTSHFDRVLATDASREQIANARPHAQIRYLVSAAEKAVFEAASIDLITVAQALHWFDIPAFFAEARRVLKQDGILAVWTYNLLKVEPAIDTLIEQLYHQQLAGYWPPQRTLVEQGYSTIAFPFAPLEHPEFAMEADWNLSQLLGYLETWSAVKGKQAKTGENPVSQMAGGFAAAWGDPAGRRRVRWPLSLMVGQHKEEGR
jgi:SAM-dependent methyltransferase